MEKTIIIIIFILSLPLAFALYGGESQLIYSFDNCRNFTVNVIGTRDFGDEEYSLIGCTEIEANKWFCVCDDKFDLILSTKINTVNKYNISINYSYQIEYSDEVMLEIIKGIKIETENIIINEIKYSDNILTLNLTGKGETIVKIYTDLLGKPYKVLVGGDEVSFVFNNGIVEFNTTFSTKIIELDYDFPTQETITKKKVSSSGGFTCNSETNIEKDICENNICPRYLDVNNCSREPWSKHLCCVYYSKEVTDIPAEEDVDEEVEDVVDVEEQVQEEPPEEVPEKKSKLGYVLIGIGVIIILVSIIRYKKYKKKINKVDEAEEK